MISCGKPAEGPATERIGRVDFGLSVVWPETLLANSRGLQTVVVCSEHTRCKRTREHASSREHALPFNGIARAQSRTDAHALTSTHSHAHACARTCQRHTRRRARDSDAHAHLRSLPPGVRPYARMHIRARAHPHTRIHVHAHHTLTLTLTLTRVRTYAVRTHAHTSTLTRTRTHKRTHARTHARTNMHTHARSAHARTCTRTSTHAHARTRIRARTRAHTHLPCTKARTRIYTHAHSHTYPAESVHRPRRPGRVSTRPAPVPVPGLRPAGGPAPLCSQYQNCAGPVLASTRPAKSASDSEAGPRCSRSPGDASDSKAWPPAARELHKRQTFPM